MDRECKGKERDLKLRATDAVDDCVRIWKIVKKKMYSYTCIQQIHNSFLHGIHVQLSYNLLKFMNHLRFNNSPSAAVLTPRKETKRKQTKQKHRAV